MPARLAHVAPTSVGSPHPRSWCTHQERPHIQIQRTNRGGRKYLTVVVGLDAHGKAVAPSFPPCAVLSLPSPPPFRTSPRGVRGAALADVDLKKATKQFANKFACGCSVAKNVIGINELVIQGDVVDDLVDYIQETWPAVRRQAILCSL